MELDPRVATVAKVLLDAVNDPDLPQEFTFSGSMAGGSDDMPPITIEIDARRMKKKLQEVYYHAKFDDGTKTCVGSGLTGSWAAACFVIGFFTPRLIC